MNPDALPSWLNPFWREEYTLVTRLPPEVCERLLRAHVAYVYSPLAWIGLDRRPARGRIWRDRFWLRRATRIRNDLQTVASGAWVADTSQARRTLVRVTLSSPRVAAWILVGWFALVGLFTLAGLMNALAHPAELHLDDVFELIVPLEALGLGLAVFAFPRWLARGDATFLIGFLRDILQANQVLGPRPHL